MLKARLEKLRAEANRGGSFVLEKSPCFEVVQKDPI